MSEFIERFESWTLSSKPCCFSLDQMRHIYTFISNYITSHSTHDHLVSHLIDLVRSKPFLFLPVATKEREIDVDNRPVLGQFHIIRLSKLFWKDPTGLFAKYNRADDIDMIRFVQPVYGERMRQVFVEQFELTDTPPLSDYVDLLEHVCFLSDTGKSPFSDEETLRDVFVLYECLVDKCVELSAEFDSTIDSAAPLKQQVSSAVRLHLESLISRKAVIPCYKKNRITWQSLSGPNATVCLADAELDLAEKFSEKINIAIVNPTWNSDGNSEEEEERFVRSCRFDDTTQTSAKLLFFWLDLLQLGCFSSLVVLDLENITECLMEAPVHVQNRCRRLVPLVQCFLASRGPECRPIYERLKSIGVKEKLDKLKIYSVKELQNIYRFKHESSIYCQVSNRTCLDLNSNSANWKFYIRWDVIESVKDVIKGFIRIFTRLDDLSMSESCAKDLLSFCLIMQQFDLSVGSSSDSSSSPIRLNDEDRREIERDYRVKLHLPVEEAKWTLNDLQPLPSQWSNTVEEGEIVEGDGMMMPDRNRPYRNQANNNGPSKREKLYELERISRNQMNLPTSTVTHEQITNNQFVYRSNHPNPNANHHHYANMNQPHLYNNQTGQFNLKPDLNSSTSLQQSSAAAGDQLSLKRFSDPTSSSSKEETSPDMFDFDVRPKIAQSILDSLASMSRFGEQMSQNDQQFCYMIGRWGEMWVNEALKSRYQSELASKEIKIEWMNETAESGLPYDIRITRIGRHALESEANFGSAATNSDTTNESQVVAYIEVKSTRKTEQESFPISYQELLFAQKYQAKYEIYRVYGAGMNRANDEQPIRVKIFRNVPRLLNAHKLNLFIVI